MTMVVMILFKEPQQWRCLVLAVNKLPLLPKMFHLGLGL
jgi:hypothetical protein